MLFQKYRRLLFYLILFSKKLEKKFYGCGKFELRIQDNHEKPILNFIHLKIFTIAK